MLSLTGGSEVPPHIKPAVDVPAPPIDFLAVLNSATSVHAVPFHDSFLLETPEPPLFSPPKYKKASVVPFVVLAANFLPAFKSATSVHVEPFHSSVVTGKVLGPLVPPAPIAAVYIPAPLSADLPSLRAVPVDQDPPVGTGSEVLFCTVNP